MIYLLGAMNLYQKSIISCFVIMTIVGLILIIVDKKRWIAHTKRSADMMNRKAKASITTEEREEFVEEENVGKKKVQKDKEYEYEGRIKDRTLFVFAILFGAFGEFLGMVFAKHKWHRSYFKIGMPILAILEVFFVIFLVFIVGEIGGDGAIQVT